MNDDYRVVAVDYGDAVYCMHCHDVNCDEFPEIVPTYTSDLHTDQAPQYPDGLVCAGCDETIFEESEW